MGVDRPSVVTIELQEGTHRSDNLAIRPGKGGKKAKGICVENPGAPGWNLAAQMVPRALLDRAGKCQMGFI